MTSSAHSRLTTQQEAFREQRPTSLRIGVSHLASCLYEVLIYPSENLCRSGTLRRRNSRPKLDRLPPVLFLIRFFYVKTSAVYCLLVTATRVVSKTFAVVEYRGSSRGGSLLLRRGSSFDAFNFCQMVVSLLFYFWISSGPPAREKRRQ